MTRRKQRRTSTSANRSPFLRVARVIAHNLIAGTNLTTRRRPAYSTTFELVTLIDPLLRGVTVPAKKAEAPGDLLLRRLRVYARANRRLRPLPALPASLARNFDVLVRAIGGGTVERTILVVLVAGRSVPDLTELFNNFGELTSSASAMSVLASASGLRPADVARALRAGSPLLASGLLRLETSTYDFLHKITLKNGLADLLVGRRVDAKAILARYLPHPAPSTLTRADFAHLREPLEIAARLLRSARAQRRRGVNVLLYGATGTGKSELARLLAREIGVPLFAASAADDDGASLEIAERLASLRLGNQLLASGKGVLLFDELEDVFDWRHNGFARTASVSTSKQWFNDLLESNPVPTIWITNETDGIDPAFLRRFSYAIEMRDPGVRVRARVLARHLGRRTLPASDFDAIAQRFTASPAQLGKAVEVARLMSASPDREAIERVLAPVEKLLTGRDPSRTRIFDPSGYRLDAVNARENLAAVVERLSAWRPGNKPGVSLCLYGPPGTGKSELVSYLAWRMGRRLVHRRVSDIQSMWVGEAEKNIAEAFREAEDDDAVLLFDEADSFLRDRRDATRSWEVTQVNEFLQQLESFRGVVACTTNLWHDLDAAALRRFVFKIELRFLAPAQSWALFTTAFAKPLAKARASDRAAAHDAIASLANVTPGDIAAVARRAEALGDSIGVRELAAQVRAECAVKRGPAAAVGFRA